MLKGVNRQVVEVAQPECVYFEKVLFFVKPEYSSVSETKLKSKADALIKNATAAPEEKKRFQRNSRIGQFAKMAIAAVSGAVAAAAGFLVFIS
ncbi:MAG: hypothetical protein IKL10_05480 [Clostridia bacterium]|nr:hypothetical protein [Clostridia bacterium]